MANTFTDIKRTLWAREMQAYYFQEGNLWRQQANFRLESQLKQGSSIKRPSGSNVMPKTYTIGSNTSGTDLTTATETLTVDKIETAPFEISDLDEVQNYPEQRDYYTKKAVDALKISVNGRYLAEAANASSVVDAADFGGTSGNGVSATTSNVAKLFTIAQKKMGRINTWGKGAMFANITPDVYQVLVEYLSNRESNLGDSRNVDGKVGEFMGFDIYVTNTGYWTGTLKLATNPTNGDTVTIKAGGTTMTFNFVSSIGSTSGNVLIGGGNDTTGANLAALINAPTTTNSNQVGWSAGSDQHFALYGCTATYTAGTDLLTLTWRGVGAPVVSDTLTAATDGWDVSGATGKNISHCLFGARDSVDFVFQKNFEMQVDRLELRIGEHFIKPFTMYGLKTFTDGAKKLVNVKVDTTSNT